MKKDIKLLFFGAILIILGSILKLLDVNRITPEQFIKELIIEPFQKVKRNIRKIETNRQFSLIISLIGLDQQMVMSFISENDVNSFIKLIKNAINDKRQHKGGAVLSDGNTGRWPTLHDPWHEPLERSNAGEYGCPSCRQRQTDAFLAPLIIIVLALLIRAQLLLIRTRLDNII